ncbi:GntR family transcriptional regulator [Flavobacterium sp.]|uniref:GntR family transcriptional regulator n=1 Tax=Flavobacterium sp. TaxID=239 RepID=UPI0026023341|nr:GntR family transcriptional regulator [Flavobacterium sp.]MDD2986986.1 GntR family transcriptional regulator [Flavobacterium sp.]
MKLFSLETKSAVPKYKQLVQSVEVAILEKRIKKGDRLPSLNKVCLEFGISRDTVLLAYEELKKRGIVYAILGKGYYIKSVEFSFDHRFFVLFDELNSFKEDLYSSILEAIGEKAHIDIFFHHFNLAMFRKLINESKGDYSKYIIMPTNLVGAAAIIKTLPKNEVYILDQTNSELADYPSVYQNFVKDMYQALVQAKEKLAKYEQLILIFPGYKEPLGMVEGFLNFTTDFSFKHKVIPDFDMQTIEKGTVYVIPNDRHLVQVIEQAKLQNLDLGVDFGIISYNDTSLKKIVANGITTISTDFKAMGFTLVDMIFSNTKAQIENNSQLIIRASL